uniref:Aldehyde oxidase/xanthine dehydrogenase second molybdopterin binding domain-containing protein n=1 Tax=Oryza glumipatula TaxID=40148 RepID=A0A0D9ZEF9_9ORYZ
MHRAVKEGEGGIKARSCKGSASSRMRSTRPTPMGWSSTTARGVDTILKQFNVELINSARDHKRVLSSKASGEPPPLLASSVHCAMREAIRAARKEFAGAGGSALTFQMDVSLRPRRCRVVPRVANLIGSHRNTEISKIWSDILNRI